MTDPIPPLAKCSCGKPSWNVRDITYATKKWGTYMCLSCSPMTQKPHQSDEVSAPAKIVSTALQEPVYQRPEEEVRVENSWLTTNPIEDIPF